jgi:fatty-acid peroxygenase
MDRVVLYGELHELLTRAVCTWAGVPLAEPIVQERTRQLTALFDGAGAVGPRHWRSRLARQQSERWLADLVQRIRAGQYKPPYWSAAHRIACHRELDGEQLTPQDAAVELLNVLLPTVAVSVYIVFAAHALHCYPRCRSRLEAGDARYAQHFVQEVRRFYPFFPAVPARVRKDFDWRGCRFQAGRRAILDLHGINHDPRLWEAPHEFQPERFEQWDGDQYEFVPQGGGAHPIHHRCPGEWITVALMRTALSFLTQQIDYAVPSQDLAIDCARLPALPRSRFVIADVRLRSIAPAVNGERRRGLTPGAHSY